MPFDLVQAVVGATIWALTVIGLPGLFALMVVESFGLPPVPSEVIVPFAGYLVAQGTYPLAGAVVAALGGALVGSFAAYALGRWGRTWIASGRLRRWGLEERHMVQMDAFFARRGEITVALARLVPVVRGYISYPAGAAKMAPVKFGTYTFLGGAPFILGLLYAGIVLRAHWDSVTALFAPINYVALGVIVVGAAYLLLLGTGRVRAGWPPRWRRTAPAPDGDGPRP